MILLQIGKNVDDNIQTETPKDNGENPRRGARSSVSWPGSTWADSHYHGITLYFEAVGSSYGHNHTFTGASKSVSVVQPSVFAAVWIRTA